MHGLSAALKINDFGVGVILQCDVVPEKQVYKL
jgi:hypothetical protein